MNQKVIREIRKKKLYEKLGKITLPKKGEVLVNPFASEDNPHRKGTYTGYKVYCGVVNPGIYFKISDGENTWELPCDIFNNCKTDRNDINDNRMEWIK